MPDTIYADYDYDISLASMSSNIAGSTARTSVQSGIPFIRLRLETCALQVLVLEELNTVCIPVKCDL